MKRVARRASWPMGFTMTPMIDIIFQLIIFFLAVNQFQKAEADPTLRLPLASPEQADIERPAQNPRLIVNLRPGEPANVAGKGIADGELAEFLRISKDQAKPDELEVWIRTDRSVPYRQVEPILLACADVGIWNVAFKVLTQESPTRPIETGPAEKRP